MNRVIVLYATREGHTIRIAEHLAAELRLQGIEADVFDVAGTYLPPDLSVYSGAVVAASIHVAKHEAEMTSFVVHHRDELQRIPTTVFLSVSLTEAQAENAKMPPNQRERARAEACGWIDQFVRHTGWKPSRTQAVAGALQYSKYGWIKRYFVKKVVGQKGGDVDTSRDYDYTDWAALDLLAADMAGAVRVATSVPA
jgi:menaquinone-dependent protoporphyrinogen oxidase